MAACFGTDFKLDAKRLHDVFEAARCFALASGVSIRSLADSENGAILAEPAPCTLFPSLVPNSSLQVIKDCLKDFNRLIHKVAHDHQFLETALKNVLSVDEFTRGLWDVYTQVREEGFTQTLSLAINRNDFMLSATHPSHIQPKQVEFNTIAAGFAGLSTSITPLHRLTLDMIGKLYSRDQVPDNDPASGLATCMLKAWELYGNKQAVILFLVSDVETNIFDQRALEFKVYFINRSVRVIRKTFTDIINTATLTSDKRLHIDGEEVAVIYLRSGYGPGSYPTQKEWDARLMLERSLAIKCPSVQYQLAGTKKIQQELARPGSVERFIHDNDAVERIRATFVELRSLDLGPEGDSAVELALANPGNYVLKPQREGGGNNLYDADLEKFLKQNRQSSDRNACILMERIVPPSQKNYIKRLNAPLSLTNVVNELGVYGAYIGTATEELLNEECGHMMRTKAQGTNEGGFCAGFAVVDSPFVIDDHQYQFHTCHTKHSLSLHTHAT